MSPAVMCAEDDMIVIVAVGGFYSFIVHTWFGIQQYGDMRHF